MDVRVEEQAAEQAAEQGESLFDGEVLVAFGDAVKAMGDGKLGGYLVRFTDDADLEGEAFGKDTDFGPHRTTRVYYQHAADSKMGLRVLDEEAKIGVDDVGVWIEAQLALRDKYERFIYEAAQAGKMGWSSGTAKHLVKKQKNGGVTRIVSWPLGLDASITPTPAEPRNAVMPLKSLTVAELEIAEEPAEAPESAPVKAVEVEPVIHVQERTKMPDEIKTESPQIDVNSITDAIWAGITKRMADEPAFQKALNVLPEGKDRPAEKSFADYLVALQRGDTKRIEQVYKAALAETSGDTGGYIVPVEYANSILQIAQEQSVVRRCGPTVIPMGTREFNYPVLDYSATTAGRPHRLGGVVATWTEEAGEKTETEPTFSNVKLVYHELSGYTLASNMVMQDAPALESLLRRLFAEAIGFYEDWAFLNGTGAGQPLGIFNSGALLAEVAASATFVLSDAANMMALFHSRQPNGGVWIMHPRLISYLIQLADGSGAANNVIWISNARDNVGSLSLFGRPIYFTEAMPALPPSTSAATKGGALLADMSYYLIGDRGALTIDYSPHYKFINNQGTWRFCKYVDGQPALKTYLTLADGSWTVSPFVTLKGA